MNKFHAHWHGYFCLVSCLEQLTACRIDLKRDDVVRFLIGDQQERAVWGNRKVARLPALGGCMVLIGQPARLLINKKTDDAVVPAIGGIQIFPISTTLSVEHR